MARQCCGYPALAMLSKSCDACRMSEQPVTPAAAVPQWDRADRLRKALRHAGMSPGQMAEYLEVGGNTVSTWINGRIDPRPQTLRLWALRTGVPYAWLCHGDQLPCETHRRVTGKADCLSAVAA